MPNIQIHFPPINPIQITATGLSDYDLSFAKGIFHASLAQTDNAIMQRLQQLTPYLASQQDMMQMMEHIKRQAEVNRHLEARIDELESRLNAQR